MPVFQVFYKPRLTTGEIISIKELDEIPSGVVVSGSYGLYASYSANASSGGQFYLIYDPVNDTFYTPVGNPSHGIARKVIDKFINSWAYKSFELTRNPVDSIADTSDLQSKILNALKLWLLIGLGVAAAILIVRYGYVFLLRFIFPVAIIGAISRIGRNKDDS